jgi:outer membrane protein assembly factor BamA
VLRLGAAQRKDVDTPEIEAAWNSLNPGREFLIAPTLSYGFDGIQYELFSGPLRGFGLLLEAETNYFPARAFATERVRLDLAQYQQLWGRSLLAIQGIAGFSFNLTDGTDFRNPFFVSSDDIFRAYSFNDDRLRGNYLLGAKTEFRFPIGELFKFEPLRGILAADYGSVWRRWRDIDAGATASWSSGVAFNIPPLSFSFLFSRPIRVAEGIQEASVFHFTLRYLYL